MKRNAISAFAFLAVFLLLATSVSAASNAVSQSFRGRVLGAATVNVQIPPTIEGPGLVLPDSPLFFADNLKQNIRLMFAFTSEEKVKVYEDIAGERLAELRFMLAKNNKSAAQLSLNAVSENLQKAGDELSMVKLSGRDITGLAKKLNDDIKLKQQYLDVLEAEAQGELKAQVTAVQEGLLLAKVKVEEALPEEELGNEINYDLDRQVQRQVMQTSNLTKRMQEDVNELIKEASSAAERSLKNREEMLKKAIAEKNEILQREHQKALVDERLKNTKLMKLEANEAEQVMQTVKRAQEAAVSYQNVRKNVVELRSSTAGLSATPVQKLTPTPIP